MAIDRDSRLRGAKAIAVGGSQSLTGRLPKNDFEDLVRFSAGSSTSFNLDLTNIAKKNNVDVELYRLKRPANQVIRSIGKIEFRRLKSKDKNANLQLIAASRQGSNKNEKITATVDGDLVLRFIKRSGTSTGYRATITSGAVTNPPVTNPPVTNPPVTNPPVTNPPVTNPPVIPPGPVPFPITSLPAGNTTTSRIDPTVGTEKRFSVDLATPGDYQFNLTGLSANADLRVFAADDTTEIKTSATPGTAAERLILPLNAGKYILRVVGATATTATSFGLSVVKQEDTVLNSEATPTDLGTLGTTAINKANYVVTNGKDSPIDYLKFTVPSRGFARFELAGKSTEGGLLFGDLDIDLYKEGTPIAEGTSSAGAGTAAEVFGGTLEAGVYRLRIQPKPGINTGSGYNLKITFGDRGSAPSIVQDVLPGASSSNATNFTEVAGLVYFTADTVDAQGLQKTSLWSSDGTLTNSNRLFDFNRTGNGLSQFTKVGNKLYFVANDGISGNELWVSDGTTAKLAAELQPGADGSNPRGLTAVGNNLFFYTNQSDGGVGQEIQKLYRLDTATANAQPQLLTDSDPANTGPKPQLQLDVTAGFVALGNSFYFSATDFGTGSTDLWRANVAGSAVTVEKMPLISGLVGSLPTSLTAVGNTLFLVANTAQGTQEVVRINTWSTTLTPSNFTVFDLNGNSGAAAKNLIYNAAADRLYFRATVAGDTELYSIATPATPATTTAALVKDINVGGNSNPTSMVNVGSQLVFSAQDGSGGSSTVTGENLWITDGTAANTRKLSTITSGVGEPDFSRIVNLTNLKEFTAVGNNLLFVGTNSVVGQELRQITLTGTGAATTGVLKGFDIFSGESNGSPNSSSPVGLTTAGQFVFFVANGGPGSGNEPYSVLPG